MARINGKELFEIKDEIVAKNNCGESLASDIAISIDSVVDYYASNLKIEDEEERRQLESTILNAAMNANYKVMVSDRQIRSYEARNGLFEVTPVINGGQILAFNKRITLPSSYTESHPAYERLLVRDMMTLARSAKNEVTHDGNEITRRNGFEYTTYTLNNGEITTRSHGYGLEKGVLDYTEMEIMSSSYGQEVEPKDNNDERIVVGNLLDSTFINLRETMMRSAYTGDLEEFKTVLSNAGISYELLERSLDRLYDLEEAKKRAIGDDEKFKEMSAKIDEFTRVELAPITNALGLNLSSTLSESKVK